MIAWRFDGARPSLIALLVVVVPAVFLWDFLTFRQVFYYFDFEIQWIPLHQFAHNALRDGQSLLWNPYVMFGFPQHAESQVGMFYPPTMLLHWLPRQEYAISLSLYLHAMLAIGSTYLFARRSKLEALPAIQVALCFGLSGFMFAQMNSYNIVLAAAYLPLKLLLVTCYFQRGQARYLLYFALVFGVELLIAHTNTSFISTVGVGLYFLSFVRHRGPRRRRDLALFAAYGLLGAVIGLVQLLPTYELANHTPRAGGVSYDMATSFSHSFSQYLTAFFPMMFGASRIGYSGGDYFEELFFYAGIVGILLALFGAWQLLRRRDNRQVAALGLIALLALLISLGSNNLFIDLYRGLVYLPGFDSFRVPARWSLLLTFGLAMLSGYGLQTLTKLLVRGEWRRSSATIAAIAVLAPLAVLILGGGDTAYDRQGLIAKILQPLNADLSSLGAEDRVLWGLLTRVSPAVYFVSLVLALLALIALRVRKLPVRVIAPAIVVLGLVDLLIVNKPLNHRAPSDFYDTPDHIRILQSMAGLDRVTSTYAVPNTQSVNHYMSAHYRILSDRGYGPLTTSNYLRFEPHLQREDIRDFTGVRYEIAQRPDGGQDIRTRAGAFPRAFLLYRFAPVDDDNAAFEMFLGMSPDSRKSLAVITRRMAARLSIPDNRDDPGVVESAEVSPAAITDYRHTQVKLHATTDRPALMVLTDAYYPGWRARVNGDATPMVPVHGFFRGVYLDGPGTYEVEMVYRPQSFRAGALWSLLGLSIAFVLWIRLVGRRIDWRTRLVFLKVSRTRKYRHPTPAVNVPAGRRNQRRRRRQ